RFHLVRDLSSLVIRVGSPRTANATAGGNATFPIRKPSRLSSPRHGSRLGDQRSPELSGRKQSVSRNPVQCGCPAFPWPEKANHEARAFPNFVRSELLSR
ncbi:hypothetical protein MUK42_17759, partial [Musa troglodytarum]